jgi:hypothetical protein
MTEAIDQAISIEIRGENMLSLLQRSRGSSEGIELDVRALRTSSFRDSNGMPKAYTPLSAQKECKDLARVVVRLNSIQ